MKNLDCNTKHILIVDDQSSVRNFLREILAAKYHCEMVSSAEEALEILKTDYFNLVLSDIEMGKMSGIELVSQTHDSLPDTVFVMISGNQDIEDAVESMRVGAFDYIKKPFNIDQIEIAIERALNHQSLLFSKHQYENHLEELVKIRTEELNYVSNYDVLTELPNRNLFEDRLSQALSHVNYNRKNLAILRISLDQLKNVFDVFGQCFGKALLKEAAKRLKNFLFEGVTVARFEGNEFAVMLTQINGTEEVVEFTNKLMNSLNQSFLIENNQFFVPFSIGISLFPNDGGDAETLLKNAGIALTRSREEERTGYQFFTTEMNSFAQKRMEMEMNLRHALERNEFEVYYQPKLCTKTRKIIGMEALVRWNRPDSNFVSPAEFIPLAEETGLIIPIGEWVLRTACNQLKTWQDEGFPPLIVSVNLSAQQFHQPDLLEVIKNIIKETKINPNNLELELTESSILKNKSKVIGILDELKSIGIKISIDDFGTGYSSLSYLKRLPLDILKIDKSFIQDMTISPDEASLVMTIISLAHNLGLKVIAEGVETEEQLRFLHLLRCDGWQGYLYSKPVSANLFRELLIEKSQETTTAWQPDFFRTNLPREMAEIHCSGF